MRTRLSQFLSYVRPHRGLVLVAAAAGIVRYLIPLAVPWGIKILVDDVLARPGSPDGFFRLHWVIGSLLVAYLVWLAASYFRLYCSGLAGHRIIFDLRHRLFVHLQKMSLNFFERQQIGSIVSRMTDDIGKAQDVVGYGIIAALMDVTSVLAVTVILFRMHGQLALVSLALFPVYMWISRWFMRKMRESNRRIQENTAQLSGHLYEKFSGVSLVQSFSREWHEETVFLGHSKSYFDSLLDNVKLQAAGLSVTGFLVAVTPLVVIWYGGFHVLSGSLTLGELIAFYAYVGLLYTPVARLMDLSVVVSGAMAAVDRIFEVFDQHPEVSEKPTAVRMERAKGRLTFDGVSFAYENGRRNILREVNFDIGGGERVALIGSSGSGKSTILKLLLRFYDVTRGAVLVDGVDIRNLTLASLREQIALVTQEPILFSGTILENIQYGKMGASAEDAIRAAQAIHAHEFIMALPGQYGTRVGERGVMLSVGEKQRIAIARAFLKNAPILLLDEPTSALDDASASFIRRSLEDLRRGRTVLEVTHRMAAAEGADRVLRLDGGKIVDAFSPNSCKILPDRVPLTAGS